MVILTTYCAHWDVPPSDGLAFVDRSQESVSGDSWMYPDPNVGALWEIPPKKLQFIVGRKMGYNLQDSPRIVP